MIEAINKQEAQDLISTSPELKSNFQKEKPKDRNGIHTK